MSKVKCLGVRLSTLYGPSKGCCSGLRMASCQTEDMCTCSEAVWNVNSAMMRTDRRSMKLLHGRLEALYI